MVYSDLFAIEIEREVKATLEAQAYQTEVADTSSPIDRGDGRGSAQSRVAVAIQIRF
jgi:hypothetical protein